MLTAKRKFKPETRQKQKQRRIQILKSNRSPFFQNSLPDKSNSQIQIKFKTVAFKKEFNNANNLKETPKQKIKSVFRTRKCFYLKLPPALKLLKYVSNQTINCLFLPSRWFQTINATNRSHGTFLKNGPGTKFWPNVFRLWPFFSMICWDKSWDKFWTPARCHFAAMLPFCCHAAILLLPKVLKRREWEWMRGGSKC